MADVKRNTNKAAPDAMDSLSAAIGARYATTSPSCLARFQTNHDGYDRVKITTASPHSQTLHGTLFTACPMLNVVAINTAPAPPNPSSTLSNQPGNYHIIPVKHISSFEVVSLDPNAAKQSFSSAQPPIATVDLKKLREREEAKIRELREQERKKGKGVTREAQQIYNALDRMCVVCPHRLIVPHSTDRFQTQVPYPLARARDCRQRRRHHQPSLYRRRLQVSQRKRVITRHDPQGPGRREEEDGPAHRPGRYTTPWRTQEGRLKHLPF